MASLRVADAVGVRTRRSNVEDDACCRSRSIVAPVEIAGDEGPLLLDARRRDRSGCRLRALRRAAAVRAQGAALCALAARCCGAARARAGRRGAIVSPAITCSTALQSRERRRLQQRDLDGEPLMLGAVHGLVVAQQQVRDAQQLGVRELSPQRRGSSARSSGETREHRLVRAAGEQQQVAHEVQQVAIEHLEIASAVRGFLQRLEDRARDRRRRSASRRGRRSSCRRGRGSWPRRRRVMVRPLKAMI